MAYIDLDVEKRLLKLITSTCHAHWKKNTFSECTWGVGLLSYVVIKDANSYTAHSRYHITFSKLQKRHKVYLLVSYGCVSFMNLKSDLCFNLKVVCCVQYCVILYLDIYWESIVYSVYSSPSRFSIKILSIGWSNHSISDTTNWHDVHIYACNCKWNENLRRYVILKVFLVWLVCNIEIKKIHSPGAERNQNIYRHNIPYGKFKIKVEFEI